MKTSRTLKGPKRQAPVTGFDPNLLPVNGRVRPAAPFVYVHYSGAWEFHSTQGWVPQLSKLVAMPGVNGVDERGDLTRAIQGAVSKGGTYINPKDRRLLLDGEDEDEALYFDYARFYECTDGRKWWVTVGQEPTVTRSGRILWNADEASEVFAAFRAHLRDAGIIEPMHDLVFREKMDSQRARIDNLRGRAGMNPHLTVQLQQAEQQLVAMEAAHAKQVDLDLEQPTIKPRRKRSKT